MSICKPECNNDILPFIREQFRVYNATLSGFSVSIPFNVYKIPILKGYQVVDPFGNEVEIEFTRGPLKSVQINSNIPLDNHHLILY